MLYPRISRSDQEPAAKILCRAFRVGALLMVTGGLVLAVLAEPLIVLLYGSAFQPSAAVLQLLLPGFVISGVAATLGSYFTGTGRARIFLFCRPDPALQLLLPDSMPQWGLKGAALAISIGQAVYGVVLVPF